MTEKTMFNRLNKVYKREFGDLMTDEWYANPDDQPNIWKFHRPSREMTVIMELSEDGKKISITEYRPSGEKNYNVIV